MNININIIYGLPFMNENERIESTYNSIRNISKMMPKAKVIIFLMSIKEHTILEEMYARGMTLTDIKEMIKEIYKIDLSNQTINTLTESVSEKIEEWQKRPLQECYPFVYVDCLYCYVKEDLVSVKKTVYVMLGIDTEGKKEVIVIWIDKTERATFWNGIKVIKLSKPCKSIYYCSNFWVDRN